MPEVPSKDIFRKHTHTQTAQLHVTTILSLHNVSLKCLSQVIRYALDKHYLYRNHKMGNNSIVTDDRIMGLKHPISSCNPVSVASLKYLLQNALHMFQTNLYTEIKNAGNSVASI